MLGQPLLNRGELLNFVRAVLAVAVAGFPRCGDRTCAITVCGDDGLGYDKIRVRTSWLRAIVCIEDGYRALGTEKRVTGHLVCEINFRELR